MNLPPLNNFFKKNNNVEENIIDFNKKITLLWENVVNYKLTDVNEIRNQISILTEQIDADKTLDTYKKMICYKRLLNLHNYLTLVDLPNGLKVASQFISNKDKNKVGMIFYKESLDLFREKTNWFEDLFNQTILLDEDENNILVETDNNNLAFLANMIIDLDNKEILYERINEEENTRIFYSRIRFKEYNIL